MVSKRERERGRWIRRYVSLLDLTIIVVNKNSPRETTLTNRIRNMKGH